ncbi:hypothetical protein H4S00_000333 [Coemansia sp. D1744]|nr:hypothetical protein H4S00_000333 [Coemansia sp. D1744]
MSAMLSATGTCCMVMLTLRMTVDVDHDVHICDMFEQLQHLVDTHNHSDVGRDMYDSLCETGVITGYIPHGNLGESEFGFNSDKDLETNWVTSPPCAGSQSFDSEIESAVPAAVSPVDLPAVSSVESPAVSPVGLLRCGPYSATGFGRDKGTNLDTANGAPPVTKFPRKRQTMEHYIDMPPRPEKRMCHLPNLQAQAL